MNKRLVREKFFSLFLFRFKNYSSRFLPAVGVSYEVV
jgi:hypothetical protein